MSGFTQYLRDTRAELRHVAWPTRTQTVVYSTLVAAVSIIVALYLGLFDLLFTSTLARFLETLPVNIPAQTEQVENNQNSASATKSATATDSILPTIEIPISQ
ncbi:MAG TPA: preprotein translocase subunit SecE [Candidatus Paceibacterota bacterium]